MSAKTEQDHRTEVPELRIVDDALWRAVKARQAVLTKQFEPTTIAVREARALRMHSLRRPAFLLSGLLTCSCCGGKYGIVAKERYGCLNHFRRGRCDNLRTIKREAIERRALEEADRNALARIERGIRGIIQAIEDGMYQPAMKARMAELERQKVEIEARLTEAPADVPDVHPNVAEIYRRKVSSLAETLGDPETREDAAEAIRSLVGQVVLTPGEGRGEVKAKLCGELMAILDLAAGRSPPPRPEVITTVVAGPRNH